MTGVIDVMIVTVVVIGESASAVHMRAIVAMSELATQLILFQTFSCFQSKLQQRS